MEKRLYIGSLSYDTTEEGLREFFAKIGEVESAKIITDKISGRSKGFGFVEMVKEKDAKKAKDELNGKELDGRALVIDEARPMQKRSFGPDSPGRGDFNQ